MPDCYVNLFDLADFASRWPDLNLLGLADFTSQWLKCTIPFEAGCKHAPEIIQIKVMSFNILQAGNSCNEIGSTSPLYQQPRHQDIANVIIEAGADIVGIQEHESGGQILSYLQANDPNWQQLGKLYAKFPIEQDPYNPVNSSRNSYAYRVQLTDTQWVYVHVAHWWPAGGYGPTVVQGRIIADTVPADLVQFEQEILNQVSIQSAYNETRDRLLTHVNAGRMVFLTGDFNEASYLDWTADYYTNGADRWVNNPSGTPLRFDIEWRGSKTLTDSGMTDAYRAIYPDPVTKAGNTWTPPYANNTPGRRPYDADPPDGPNQVLDRIDWVMFAGNGIQLLDTAVVGENPNNTEHGGKSEITPEIQYSGSWPSDHRAVIATFEINSD